MESEKHPISVGNQDEVKKKNIVLKYKDPKGKEYDNLYINLASGIFYTRKRLAGRYHFKSLGTKKFAEARAILHNTLIESTKEPLKPKRKKLIRDYYEMMWSEKLASKKKRGTLLNIERTWRLGIEPFWGNRIAEEINQQQVTEFMSWHRKQRPGVMFSQTFKYLNNIFNLIVREGDLPKNKKPKLELPNDEQRHLDEQKGRRITDDEILRIIEATDSERFKFIFSLAYSTGMRKEEICELEKTRIKKQNDLYVIELGTDHTKTGYARKIPVPKALNESLENLLRQNNRYLFPKAKDPTKPIYGQLIDKAWKKAKRKAGIKDRLRFHDFRHTAASNFAALNVNPSIACTILGMSLEVYQNVYLKLLPTDMSFATDLNAAKLTRSPDKK